MVNVGVSHFGAFLADLVFNPRDTEALPGDISMPAFCGTIRERLRDLDCRNDWFGSGIPQGQKIPLSIPVYRRGDMYRYQRLGNMVVCEHYRPGPRRSGVHTKRAGEQPYGCR